MAVPKIAINGFGRIGRIVTRIAKIQSEPILFSNERDAHAHR
jgi:glyceraldehyde-3-phosphate dehydrogenase/erythrose-4-phosphate dehydrogenase